MSRELFKLILDKDFYTRNHTRISKELFPDEVQPLAEVAIELQTNNPENYTLADIWNLFKSQNPLLTNAQKEKFYQVIQAIKAEDCLEEKVAEEILRNSWKSHIINQALDEVLLINENRSENWDKVGKLIETAKSGYLVEKEDNYIEPDLDSLLDAEVSNYTWTWNYDPLNRQLGGLGPGLFTIIAAPPDVGKTLAWVSLVFGPNGWVDQGAKVHILCNEEPALRTFLRGVCAKLGKDITEVRKGRELYRKDIAELKGKVFMKDIADFSINDIEKYCEDKDVDILIIDQLDKIGGIKDDGNNANTLQKLYERVRLIGKKYNLAPIAITQAGASAQGKLYYSYGSLNNSKTGKAGEADFIICIGMDEVTDIKPDNGYRMLNIPKNKSPIGSKLPVECFFNRNISRIDYVRETVTADSQPG